jgi:hypothetical protein
MDSQQQVARIRRRIIGARRRALTAALAPYIRQADPALACGTWPGQRYWRDCYRKAAEYMLAHSPRGGRCSPVAGMALMHGVCRTGVQEWGHAWVELPGALVFDGVRQQFYDRDGYRRATQATAEATYTTEQMVERMRAAEHYGPWHQGVLGHEAARRLDTI